VRVLWTYLRPYRWLVVLALTLAGASQALTLVDPIIFGRILDDYALAPGGRSPGELVRGALSWLAIAAVVALLARLARTLQDYLLQLVTQRFGVQIFNDGLRHTLRLSFHELENRPSGESVALLQKVRADTERFLNATINVLFSSVVGVAFITFYAITKNLALIAVFVFGVVVLGGLTGLLSRRIRTLQRSIRRETVRMAGALTESLRNVELIKSLGLVRAESRRLQDFTRRIYDLEIAKVKRARSLSFLQGGVISLLKHSILFTLLWLIFRQYLSPGELISMQFILGSIFGPLQDLGNVLLQYREAEASLTAFDALMRLPLEQRPEEPVEVGDIEELEFQDVAFRYRGSTEAAIDHVSFRVRRGETVAFVGPSGSGKSTLVKLLVGLYPPDHGTITIDGVPANVLRYNHVRRQIGFVTQDPQLFSGTIRENLLLVKPDASQAELLAALEEAQAMPILARSGEGLDTRIGEGGTRVSGGERQRLSIARALLRRPRLLIFDEATSALDSITEREITAAVRAVSQTRRHMVILIAHRLSTIAHADVIRVLEKGRIVEEGTHDALLDRHGLYYAMWRQQIGEREPPRPPRPVRWTHDEAAESEPAAIETVIVE
jgi:ATP-binding cassette subfamily B protein